MQRASVNISICKATKRTVKHAKNAKFSMSPYISNGAESSVQITKNNEEKKTPLTSIQMSILVYGKLLT